MTIEIANRLQQLRKEKGYSQEQLAEALGISRQAVSKWERAESSPDTDNLICLAKLYGVSLDELLQTDQSVEDIKKEQEEKQEEAPKRKDEDHVHIGAGGIHVHSKDGDDVHVGWDGIRVKASNKNESINISPKGIIIDSLNKRRSKTFYIVKDALSGVIVVGCALAYVLMGALANLWHPGWIVFLLIPILCSIIEGVEKKKFDCFCYPIFVTAIYLLLGFLINGWHPYWFVFITIPLYYMLVHPIDQAIHKNDPVIHINGNDEDDVIDLQDIDTKEKANDLKEELKDKDFTIKVDGTEINVTRNID